jgi:hypothetical protein
VRFSLKINKNVSQYQSTSLTNPISNIIFEASNSEEGADFVFASGEALIFLTGDVASLFIITPFFQMLL